MAMYCLQLVVLLFIFTAVICNPTIPLLQNNAEKPDIKDLLPLMKILPKPSKEEKNEAKLLYQLGNNYDPLYTSIAKPETNARDPSAIESVDHMESFMKSHPDIPDELRNMKFMVKKPNGKKKPFGKRSTQKFQDWLWNLSKCPVRYKWIDLGENVFPRFLKRGVCSKKKTCSFPAGMKCKKSNWKTVTVLMFTCLRELNSVSSHCQWRPIALDVLTECTCGCNS